MSQKLAVAVIHGIGKANPSFNDKDSPNFTSGMAQRLREQFARLLHKDVTDSDLQLEIEAIYWAPILQDLEDELGRRLKVKESLSSFLGLREFVFHSLADSIGYQITSSTPTKDREIYDKVHECFSETLEKLAQTAGGDAPLCIIAHSLGSTIASNYIWDLQHESARIEIGDTPLEKGETLTLFHTFGSQIPFWALRYDDFGTPIAVPSPKLTQHYSGLQGGWTNFYDRDDLLGYPIQRINDKYEKVVTDREVNAGNIAKNWNPLSHNEYWADNEVVIPIAQSLVNTWKSINP